MEMHDEVERYCTIVESAEQWDRLTFAWAAAESLAGLTAAAARLAPVQTPRVELPGRPTDEAWLDRFHAVQDALGEWATYWTTLHPYDADAGTAVNLTLGDDLADIWRDLKPGLAGLAAGAPLDAALWDWRLLFYTHWGAHATDALRVLHARRADAGAPFYLG
jgi:uncharacterized protein DUF5063